MEHSLKINKEYLANLMDGKKKSEIRLNDRDYQLGDYLIFRDDKKEYYFKITHIHSGLGLKEGYVVLSVSFVLQEEKYRRDK
jgi:ParB family chromosome partitioning protein